MAEFVVDSVDRGDDVALAGRFLLGDLIGVGGTASVFEAVDLAGADGADDQPVRVAVKLLHPHLCADEAARAAFLREAEAAASVRHPNVAEVYGSGIHEAGGVLMPWIATELIEGGSLADRVEGGRLSNDEAAEVAQGLLAALGAVHAAGLVHRDVTPTNILFTGTDDAPLTRERVRLVDFGIADATGRTAAAIAGEGATGAVGTAAWVSPEQVRLLPVRPSADLYQAGAVLYYALTGQPPYPRETVAEVIDAQVSAPPPVPSVLNPAARPFDRIVTRAMNKTPGRRVRTAEDFAAAVALIAGAAATAPETTAVAAVPLGPTAAAPLPVASPASAGQGTAVLSGPTEQMPLTYLEPEVIGPDQSPRPQIRRNHAGWIGALVVAALLGSLIYAGTKAPAVTPTGPTRPQPALPVEGVTATASATPTVTPTVTATPSRTPTPTPTPAVKVPPVVGMQLSEARAAIEAAGLVVGAVQSGPAAVAQGEVTAQSGGGASVPKGSRVDLTVADGTNQVPDVAGLTMGAARAKVQDAGFQATMPVGATASTPVRGTEPGPGSVLRLGVQIALIAVPEPPAPAPTSPIPTPSPTPSPKAKP